MGSESEGFSAAEGPRAVARAARGAPTENWDRFVHSVSPDAGWERGAAGTRHSQHQADSEPRHWPCRGGIAPHGSSACRPRHSLFAHASKPTLARHVLLFCSLSPLGHAAGTEMGPGATGRGKGAGFCSLAGLQWGWPVWQGNSGDTGVQPGTCVQSGCNVSHCVCPARVQLCLPPSCWLGAMGESSPAARCSRLPPVLVKAGGFTKLCSLPGRDLSHGETMGRAKQGPAELGSWCVVAQHQHW